MIFLFLKHKDVIIIIVTNTINTKIFVINMPKALNTRFKTPNVFKPIIKPSIIFALKKFSLSSCSSKKAQKT